jgi:FMN phosphatase YigB (HAD superfamily)
VNDRGRARQLVPPKALLLDLDNTLYDYDARHSLALAEIAKRFQAKYRVAEKDFREAWEASRAVVKQRLGPVASSHSRLLYLRQTLSVFGLGSEIQSAIELERIYWNSLLCGIVPTSGAAAFLERIRVMGIPCLIVTDLTTEIQLRKVLALGIADFVDYVVTSEEAGGDKVTGNPYLLAAEQLGFEGERVWMIGDDPVADVEAAIEHIGATPIQRILPGNIRLRSRPSPQAFATFSRFEQLTKALVSATHAF